MDPTASANHPRLGWIGLGSMGQAMAVNLQTHLSRTNAPSLHFYNRTEARGLPLREIGGTQSPNIQSLIAKVDICFLAVTDDNAVKSIINSMIENPDHIRDKIIVDTTTVHPDTSIWAEQSLQGVGASYIASPVFGASPVAKEGKLLFVIAGPDDAIQSIEPFVVGIMGRKILRMGRDVTRASLLKSTGNFITAGMMELIAEAHVLAEKSGLGNDVLESLIDEQYGALPFAMSKRITGGYYLPERGQRPWSDLNLAIKDVSLGVSCAEGVGARLPVAEVVLEHLCEARGYAEGNGRALDSSAMYGILRERAGLGFESEGVKKRDGGGSE
ncbi:NAD(P)-dependent oxidoreductase [Aspergillus ibericus CBS 121593]|uniref:3-hydroxyisobutyrate dehydrogenase n=1 Tax=Aspergillus ibericus CBS 121593 TaxID=1448316 RepID=A0A395GT72_9EURO|nr:3-hydroxyisobutyrate dehydrogenase [Aspergillus ibericus CBS 121593]RAK98148.1 3-hydroxyisobutyrate dehydrogenase [Aspergillus ibericus CBS 121593]